MNREKRREYMRDYMRRYNAAHRDDILAYRRAYYRIKKGQGLTVVRVCPMCGRELPAADFVDVNGQQARTLECADCMAKNTKRNIRREYMRQYMRNYRRKEERL